MRKQYHIFGGVLLAMLLVGIALWPLIHPHLSELKSTLIAYRQLAAQQPWTGYLIYSLAMALILFLGLPLATLLILLAGVTYNFWEAATLVTVCRLGVALAAFWLARHFMLPASTRRRRQRKPPFLRTFDKHPYVSLLLMRLAPLPDSVVNYSMGATSLRAHHYAVISLIGMIPATIAFVWLGGELGSISKLIQYLK